MKKFYTVKQVAELAGVTVRALHHYDRIGLLRPEKVGENGYRYYAETDLERLQQILFFRELGVELREITRIIDSPEFDRVAALRAHRELLIEQQARLGRLIETVDRTIATIESEESMSGESMFEGFDRTKIDQQIEKYHDEAISRWGPERVEESEQRVRGMSQEEWDAIGKESNEINTGLAALMDTHAPEAPEVQALVERWYRLLNQHFAEYTPAAFRGLGDLYVEDSRFTATYDKVRPGLASFLRDGMHVWADRAEGQGS